MKDATTDTEGRFCSIEIPGEEVVAADVTCGEREAADGVVVDGRVQIGIELRINPYWTEPSYCADHSSSMFVELKSTGKSVSPAISYKNTG